MNISLGKLGENAACEYLEGKGFQVVERNFRCHLGEIDLVCKDNNVLVIVEVKARYSMHYGQPFESVTYHKQRRLIRLAQTYLKFKHGTVNLMTRFDVISISYKDGKKEIKHIRDAFRV
jgi:putative endonuclease